MYSQVKGYFPNINGVSLSGVKQAATGFSQRLVKGFVLATAMLSVGLSAQTISPQMMEQVKNLPRAQQEALARQYGVDLDRILGGVAAQAPQEIAAPGAPLLQPSIADKKAVNNQSSEVKKDQKLKRFGVSLFDREVSTFAPTDDASVPDNYRLGAGDNLVIQLFGKDNAQYDLAVSRQGNINFPNLGPITLAGLTFENARELILSRVADQLIGVQATISMGRLRAINVFMAGEVAVPGAYSVSALTTITQALFQAGGISDIGSLRAIQVKRDGISVATFDAYQLLLAR